MLMDGKISAAEYHMGRGQGDSAADGDTTGNNARPRSIADMLAQPEGVSDDFADFGQLSDDGVSAEATTVLETEPAESTTVLKTSTADESQENHKSYAQMLVKPDCFPREDDADESQENGESNETGTPEATDEPQKDTEPVQPDTIDATQSQNLPKLPHRRSPSGLSVSGTVRFTPPPNSSPTFDGKPRLIRGYIAVEGYVAGDGTLVLDEAPFAVKHS